MKFKEKIKTLLKTKNMAAHSGLALGFCVGLLAVWFGGNTIQNANNTKVHEAAVTRVNYHLRWDDRKLNLNKMAVEESNHNMLKDHDWAQSEPEVDRSLSTIDVEVKDDSKAVFKDLYGDDQPQNGQFTVAEKVEMQMLKEKFLNEYRHKQNEHFVREFVRNAREQGYDVLVNDQLEIVAVSPRENVKRYRGKANLRELGY